MRGEFSPRPPSARVLYAASVALLAALAFCAASAAAFVSARHWVDHALAVRQCLEEWTTAVVDAEAGVRGYVATGKDNFLQPFEAARSRERVQAERERRLVADSVPETHNVERADADARTAMADLGVLVDLVRAGHPSDAVEQLGRSKGEMAAFRVDAQTIQTSEDRMLRARRSRAQAGAWVLSAASALLAATAVTLLALAWRRERQHESVLRALAAVALERLKVLSDLGSSLADARAPAQVAEAILEHGMRAMDADACTVHVLNASRTALDLVAYRGVEPDLASRIRRITPESDKKAFGAALAGVTTWAESIAEYAALHPDIAAMQSSRAKAFWSVPLFAEGQAMGLLGAAFDEPRNFSADERAFVGTLALQCAQALLRAARREREDEARRWLDTTLRSIGDAVIATDAQGQVTFMNPVAERLTAWDEDEACGRPLEDVFCIRSEHAHAPVANVVARVVREGAILGLANHTVLRSRRGVDIPIDDCGSPIRGEGGRILGVVVVFRDVTVEKRERTRSQFLARTGEALASSLDYESTLQTVANLVVPTFADWCTIELAERGDSASRQVAAAHADPAKVHFARDLRQGTARDLDAPHGLPSVLRTGIPELYPDISAAMLEGAGLDAERLRAVKELRVDSVMLVPLRTRGRTLGVMTFVYGGSDRRYTTNDLGFAEDFARRAAMAIENAVALKETEAARKNEQWLRAQAELASRSKDEFLATVSHELRTPLNAILGWTMTLRRRQPPPETDRALAVVERNARAQAKLIEDVLDVSRISSGKLVLHLGPTNVADAVHAAIETVTPAAEAKQIAMAARVEDESLTITADANRTQQIVWNLLSNAVKFTPKGGKVSIGVERTGSDVRIRVTDTGEGIRASALPFIFEPFRQADTSITRQHGGLGLGLAIVKQLVVAHGGSIRAESEGPGKGATFVVTLPARAAVPAVSPSASRSPSVRDASSPNNDAATRMEGLRLLVVDDEQDARGLMTEVLAERGAEVHVASSAEEALEKVAAVRPDVIVSDVGMPSTDGYALLRKVRALPADKGGRTPAVALTAYAGADDARQAIGAGYQVHVAKPVDPRHLATVVANLVDRSAPEACKQAPEPDDPGTVEDQ